MALTVQSGGVAVIEPGEDYDLSFNYAGKLPTGATIASAELFASEIMAALSATTLAAEAAVNATTISLTANVGQGAKLLIGAGTTEAETVKVSSLSGGGPYTATIVPALRYLHLAASVVHYEPGLSGVIIESTVGSLVVATAPSVHVQRLVHGRTYRLSCRITTNGGRHLEDAVMLVGRDL